ncbi:MAG: hypothetical protein C0508_21935, partial [Cyanobacteria bacterium PR.023]|nr:hypothetical protein [Cyanobacteria bacterium PR.023]
PRERAVALTKWAKEKLTPAGMSEKALDSWYTGFNHDHGGQRVYFGQFLKEGKGVCSQQAILLKLAADQFPDLSATLVRGNYYVPNKQNGGGLNHAWTEFSFGDNNRLVFDPRQRIYGEAYREGNASRHTPGREFNLPVNKPPVRLSAGERVDYNDSPDWKVRSVFGDQAIITHDGWKQASKEDVLALNGSKVLNVGVTYRLARSNGTIEDGWTLMGVSPGGKLEFCKKDAIVETVQLRDIQNSVPN